MVNNLGGTSFLELNIVARAAIKYLSKSVSTTFGKMCIQNSTDKCIFATIIQIFDGFSQLLTMLSELRSKI